MNFKNCLDEGMLTETGERDFNKAKELLALAEHKCAFWREVEKKAELYPSLFIEGHYEIIKELVIAILSLDGWKADNHDCLFQYILEKKQDLEIDFSYLSELRKLRNKIDYLGIKVSYETWKQNKLKLQVIIKTLSDHVKKQIQK